MHGLDAPFGGFLTVSRLAISDRAARDNWRSERAANGGGRLKATSFLVLPAVLRPLLYTTRGGRRFRPQIRHDCHAQFRTSHQHRLTCANF
jgi:hypothetical protein